MPILTSQNVPNRSSKEDFFAGIGDGSVSSGRMPAFAVLVVCAPAGSSTLLAKSGTAGEVSKMGGSGGGVCALGRVAASSIGETTGTEADCGTRVAGVSGMLGGTCEAGVGASRECSAAPLDINRSSNVTIFWESKARSKFNFSTSESRVCNHRWRSFNRSSSWRSCSSIVVAGFDLTCFRLAPTRHQGIPQTQVKHAPWLTVFGSKRNFIQGASLARLVCAARCLCRLTASCSRLRPSEYRRRWHQRDFRRWDNSSAGVQPHR